MGLRLLALQAVVLLIIAAASEIAFRAGLSRRANTDEPSRGQITTIQAATLGLLGLMLGFSLSMAEGRYTTRKAVIIDEANAIGTTYLRAQFLPDEIRDQSRVLLRSYVDARREYQDAGGDEQRVYAATKRGTELQAQIWALATKVARESPSSESMKLYVTSLNEMIDLEAARFAAGHTRTPTTILVLLVLVAVIATGVTGFACGLTGHRALLAVHVVPALIGLACAIVIDLDHPKVGIIRADDAAMRRLQQSMANEAP
ncbi:MAG: hypothetical protein HOW73_06565 [Polyangiaceae bacterium]|nr:hypothetical protein [Polyangiaceae bacterium]